MENLIGLGFDHEFFAVVSLLTVESLMIFWTKHGSIELATEKYWGFRWYKNCPSPIELLFLPGQAIWLTYPLPQILDGDGSLWSLPYHTIVLIDEWAFCIFCDISLELRKSPKKIDTMLSVPVLFFFFFAIGSLARRDWRQSSYRYHSDNSLSKHHCSPQSILLTPSY